MTKKLEELFNLPQEETTEPVITETEVQEPPTLS
jgi:hypothetical protein